MERQVTITADGSTTIHLTDLNEQYHSKHGAIQEAVHVFITNGFLSGQRKETSILEIGFGTGLNALLTCMFAEKEQRFVDYTGVEAYPISDKEVAAMNFASQLGQDDQHAVFLSMHTAKWEEKVVISSNFSLTKRKERIEDISDLNQYDLIYFDAFGFRVQPELWTSDIFLIMYKALKAEGTLVTYAAAGVIRRNMIEAGFMVEKLPGPPGKREMLRASKSKLLL